MNPSPPTQVDDPLAGLDVPSLPDPAEFRGALGPQVRDWLGAVRQGLRARHDAGASGSVVVGAWTAAMDTAICFLVDAATASYRRRYVQLDQRCAVLAQGGYGRAELNPNSDIDLLFLYPHKATSYLETVTETVTYALWDAKLDVGYAVRTVRDCVRMSASDLKVKTALIDARPICGDPPITEEFFRALDREIVSRGASRFFRDKLAESDERHHAHGNSVYLNEPNLKEGEGGLRDLHTALWIAKVKFKIRTMRELVVKGVVHASELAELDLARDFLFRVRNSLHFLTASHQDQLTFDLQERVAANLGYTDGVGGLRPVECFMRDYYTQAATVKRFSRAIVDRSIHPPRPYRLLGRMMSRRIRDGVIILSGELAVNDSALLRADPRELVFLFHDAQKHGVPLSATLADQIREHAPSFGDVQRDDPEVAEAFLGILRWPGRVYETLHEMHKLGVLGRLIPEWAHLLYLVQHDMYHIYTVDAHSLMGIHELEKLARGEHAATMPMLTQAMREVDKIEILFLGMMLHDVGKGLGGNHSERGAAMAAVIARRLGLNEDDSAELQFMVRHHLAMSTLAQRRDLSDDRLIIDFAKLVGTPEALKRLYLLTYADMRAVGPKVWNNWKDMLLGEAYVRVTETYARGFEPEDRVERIARIRARVVEQAIAEIRRRREEPGGGPEGDEHELAMAEVGPFLDVMPVSYFLTTPESLMVDHAELVARARRDGLATSVTHNPTADFSEFTVATADRPGLFATLTGCLAASGLNVVGARIATSKDGIALDAFRVSHLGQHDLAADDERWERVRRLLDDVLAGRRSIADALASSSRPAYLDRKRERRTASEVVVDDTTSDEFTILDVYTYDRVGVLHCIADTLFRLGLDIHLAKITTKVDQVLDVFYVTEAGGGKTQRGEEIRAALLAALAGDEATAAASAPTPSGAPPARPSSTQPTPLPGA